MHLRESKANSSNRPLGHCGRVVHVFFSGIEAVVTSNNYVKFVAGHGFESHMQSFFSLIQLMTIVFRSLNKQ